MSKSKTQKSFILGYPSDKDMNPQNLKRYKNKQEADFDTEEWCEVFASSLREAKAKYEVAFDEWQKNQQVVRTGTQRSPFGIGS